MDKFVIKCCVKNADGNYDLRFSMELEGFENICYFLDTVSFFKEGYDLCKIERI